MLILFIGIVVLLGTQFPVAILIFPVVSRLLDILLKGCPDSLVGVTGVTGLLIKDDGSPGGVL